jgi:hypothetical protein
MRFRSVKPYHSALLGCLISLCALPGHASGTVSLKDLVDQLPLERLEDPPTATVEILEIESLATGGWNGAFDDRWHSAEAFRKPFRIEFREGLAAYLSSRGFVIGSDGTRMRLRVSLDRFEGRKRFHNDGGDLEGTVTLLAEDGVVASKRLFESLSYRDQDNEKRAFRKDFQTHVSFDTVLFFRLSLGLYRSIESFLLQAKYSAEHAKKDASPDTDSPVVTSHSVATVPRKFGIVTIESEPEMAEILLDHQLLGTTPATELRIPVGSYSLIVRKNGYREWEREIVVLEGNRTNFHVELEETAD